MNQIHEVYLLFNKTRTINDYKKNYTKKSQHRLKIY